MKVSLSWLSAYVRIPEDVSRLADALTMAGLEVEAVSDRYDYLNTVVVSRIVKIDPHPQAENLTYCRADIGGRTISVVCGAPNVRENMLVPAALPGTLLPHGAALEKSVIRGLQSEGMLCSEFEIGLGSDKNGIMQLDDALTPGTRLNQALALTDTVFEVSITPNRPDCLSMIGIAREIAAIQRARVVYPEIKLPAGRKNITELSSVTIDAPEHCPRYAAGLLENISVGPSPFWLQDRLLSVGLRPINNIVDVTNFVMMETGQPLHAFDFDRLAGNRIVVRTAADGEAFATLDGKDRLLSADMLMICDGEKPVAIAGVMGGLNSEIETATRRVLIESAYFSPVSIRRTSKKLGLSTDASHRFERGVDPAGTVTALKRAAQLMLEVGGGALVSGILDEHPAPVASKSIQLKVKDANRILGTRLTQNKMAALLESIEFKVEKQQSATLQVTPPSFRVDVERPEDLMEEIARLAGYHTIPTTFPLVPAEAKRASSILALRDLVKTLMTGLGFREIITYSFVAQDSGNRLNLPPEDPRRSLLNILNPLTDDQAVMRTSLIPGLLNTLHRNLAQQNRNIKQFEIGKIFISNGQENLPREIEMLAGLWAGSRIDLSWHAKEAECDFYDIKGVVEALLSGIQIPQIKFTQANFEAASYLRPGYCAQVSCGDQALGVVGEISPRILGNFDLKQKAFVFELSLNAIAAVAPQSKQAGPLPKFPATTRDITLIVDRHIEAERILASIRRADEEWVENLFIFDIFTGNLIPADKKSVSLRIVYRSDQKTLEDETVNQLHKSITDRLLKEFGGTLPA
ncbi:MAG: phenylalanine--tRNA ligase subunit beta [Thermodesulfobacteriota bacterium]